MGKGTVMGEEEYCFRFEAMALGKNLILFFLRFKVVKAVRVPKVEGM